MGRLGYHLPAGGPDRIRRQQIFLVQQIWIGNFTPLAVFTEVPARYIYVESSRWAMLARVVRWSFMMRRQSKALMIQVKSRRTLGPL